VDKERSIKTSMERNSEAIRRRRQIARSTARTTVTLQPGGSACEIEDGPWKLVADLSTGQGGGGVAPDPGVFGRGALGACLVLGYEMWAAAMGVRIDAARVTVESDFDAAGMYGVDDTISPGWQAVRCIVEITSPDPEERVAEVVEKSHRHSPLLADISQPVAVTCDLRVTASGSE
jgi:uncharacterized OsmC-like protein